MRVISELTREQTNEISLLFRDLYLENLRSRMDRLDAGKAYLASISRRGGVNVKHAETFNEAKARIGLGRAST